MPHCIHSTKRCHACGLHTGKDCAIVEQALSDRKAPQYYPYKGFYVPIHTEKLSSEVHLMLSEFNEEG